MEEKKTERKVVISPEDWEKIVKYIFGMPVSFENAEKAVGVKQSMNNVLLVDVNIEK